MTIEFKVEGLDPILAKMKGLAPGLLKKGLRAATRKGANVIRDQARDNAKAIDDPATKNSIPKAIVVSESGKQGKQIGGIVMRVGVRGGARLSKDPESLAHWRLVEFGSSNNEARPFMRPALSQGAAKALAAIVDALGPAIDKQIAKAKQP